MSKDKLITLRTVKQTIHCTNCLFMIKRQQLSTLLYLLLNEIVVTTWMTGSIEEPSGTPRFVHQETTPCGLAQSSKRHTRTGRQSHRTLLPCSKTSAMLKCPAPLAGVEWIQCSPVVTIHSEMKTESVCDLESQGLKFKFRDIK